MSHQRVIAAVSGILAIVAVYRISRPRNMGSAVVAAYTADQLPRGGRIEAVAFGHEYRQDDCPSIAVAPDGSVWAAWLSFGGDADRVAIRKWERGRWSNLQWVPGTDGDNWLPQVIVDASNRPWAVWSQQVDGNWDLYARWFDPSRQEWGPLERLTEDPLPDINPRAWSDGKGQAAVVWQGFRGKSSSVFLRRFDGSKWLPEIRVTRHEGNDWEPSVTVDGDGIAWIAYDSYQSGNYDVFLAKVRGTNVEQSGIAVAITSRFEARPTVAADSAGRIWVAWEEAAPNWGKDQGYIIRERQPGALLGGAREVNLRCFQNGSWRQPEAVLPPEFRGGFTHHPNVYSDGRGGLWLIAMLRRDAQGAPPPTPKSKDGYQPLGERGFHEYWMTRFDGRRWSEALPLPESRGRMSSRVAMAVDADSNLWAAWPTDGRNPDAPARPVRGKVYAARIAAPEMAESAVLAPAANPTVQAASAHGDEPGDIRALRSYRIAVGTKQFRIVRGDLHRHTELSWDISGLSDGSLQDFYRYMIDVAGMDFGASTDHQGGAWPYWWWYTQKMTDMYHVPGAYIPLFGYERSAQFPFGHRNIFVLKRSDARVTPFFVKQGTPGLTLPPGAQGDEPPVGSASLVANDTVLLFEAMRRQNAIAIAHTSGNKMGTDWRFYDAALDPLAEIFQGCRTSFEQVGAPHVADKTRDAAHIANDGYQPAGMMSNAWAKGYKLGVIASSDHFSTHISYAMVYTEEASRKGILEAIRKRHAYGATDNILLDVRMGAQMMGDEFREPAPAPLRIKARGTRAIDKLEIIRDSRVIYSAAPKQQEIALTYTDRDSAALQDRHYYYVRLLQEDEMIAWSSPIFVRY